MKRRKRMTAVLLCLLMAVSVLAGCGSEGKQTAAAKAPKERYAFEYLDTVINIKVYDDVDDSVMDGCIDIIKRYDELLSRTKQGAEIYELNENGTVEMQDDVLRLLQKGLYYSELSGGVFDITAEPITSQWDFKAAEPALPDADVLAEAVKHVDYKNLVIEGNQVSLADPESGVDLGAIAKGFIADEVKDYLVSQGVKSAYINLGGNILCVGKKPDGSTFNVGLQLPFGKRDDLIAMVRIDDFSVVTSGIDQRNFTIDDKLYHHILNTETGYPCENGLLSVTIISDKSVDGDGLSTTCFALGLEKGMELINSIDGVYAAFVTEDYTIHYSEGFEECTKVVDNQ